MSAGMSLLLLASMAYGSTSTVASVRASFSTYLSAREDPRREEAVRALPVLQLVSLCASGLEVPGATRTELVARGWGRLQLGDDALADHDADVSVLYLDLGSPHFDARIGRQHLGLGMGRMLLIDGADLTLRPGAGFSIEGHAGTTVERARLSALERWAFGGRIAFNFSPFDQVGSVAVGYLQERDGSALLRHELGSDAFVRIGPTYWFASAVLGPEGDHFDLVEARLSGSVDAGAGFRITVEGERISPERLLPLTSLFSVFASSAHDSAGGEIHWEPSPYYAVDAAGHALLVADKLLGYRATLRALTFREAEHRSAIGVEARRVDESKNAYIHGRIFTTLALTTDVRVAGDILGYRYDEEVHGARASLLGQLSLVYALADSIRLTGTVLGGVSPYADGFVEGSIRFAYGYQVDFAREMEP